MISIEKSYSLVYKNILKAVNPLKKRIIKTECIVHKFINNQSLIILKNDGYMDVYYILNNYINEINAGAVWADQDLKSSNHFYNPNKDRGLYGNSNAKRECIFYYKKALNEYFNDDIKGAMFYLGAACHLIQDLTVPQHANIELLNDHRSYENWVIKMYKHHDEFKIFNGGIYNNSLKYYILHNSKQAINTYNMYSNIKNEHMRFYKITSKVLLLAQKTTAGLMYKFFYDIQKNKAIRIAKRKIMTETVK